MNMEKSQNLDTKNKISKYEIAPIAKRLFAGIMDGVVFLFTFFALALWVFTPIADHGLGYGKTYDEGQTYQLASHLYLPQKMNDDGKVVVVEIKDSTGKYEDYTVTTLYNSSSNEPSLYINRIYYYYHNFKTNTDIELPQNREYDPLVDHFASPDYNKEINGVLPVNLYTNEWFNNNILYLNEESTYFYLDTQESDYLASIKVKENKNIDDVISYLKNAAYNATSDFYYSDFYQVIEKRVENMQYFIFFIPFALAYGVYFILMPLVMKAGETLGKKSMNIAVISMDGYAAKKRQILFREILLFIVIGLLGISVGIGLTSLAVISLGVVVLFILTLIPKNKRSIFDYAAYTIVIDAIRSTWFKNEEDERRHQAEIEANMAKYKKYVPDNPNVIQIGSTIVDEKLKKEIEQEKKKK